MIAILSALFSLLSFRVRSHTSLELELIALRHQVSVLRRQRPGVAPALIEPTPISSKSRPRRRSFLIIMIPEVPNNKSSQKVLMGFKQLVWTGIVPESERAWRTMHGRLDGDLNLLAHLPRAALRSLWRQEFGESPPVTFGRELLALAIAYGRQERQYGTPAKSFVRNLDRLFERILNGPSEIEPVEPIMRPGTILVREWQGVTHHVTVVDAGYVWNGHTHRSLSKIARAITGTKWNGPRFFGLRETNHAV